MDGAIWGFIGVVVGAVITGFVTIRAESLRAEKAAALDTARRDADRRLARDEFQRENLLALQVKLVEWLRTMADMYNADLASVRETGEVDLAPGEATSREMLAGREFMYLTERVGDDGLRARLTGLRGLSVEAGQARTEDEVEAAGQAIARAGSAALEHLGTVLRTYL